MVSNSQKLQRKYNLTKKEISKSFKLMKKYIENILKYKGLYLYETVVYFIFICSLLILLSLLLYSIAGILGLIIGIVSSWMAIAVLGLLLADYK